jgi:hypothetical protein
VNVAEDEEVYAWKQLMVEAGVSPRLRRIHETLWLVLLLLFAVTVVLIVGGVVAAVFVGPIPLLIAIALFAGVVASMIATTLHRNQLIAGVRWQEGTVTLQTVEPGRVGEDGQYVVCQVTVRPPIEITRVATTVGPMDVQHLVAGTTLRCFIDRNDGFEVLHVVPPSGRALKFHKA